MDIVGLLTHMPCVCFNGCCCARLTLMLHPHSAQYIQRKLKKLWKQSPRNTAEMR